MSDREIQRVILQYAFDHQHDFLVRSIEIKSIEKLKDVELNRLRHNLIYLKKEELIENITDDYMIIRLTNPGINLLEDKSLFDAQFPMTVKIPEETKKLILNVENLLLGKYGSVLNQFQKAKRFCYYSTPSDSLNCVKEAVGAVEALAKILLNDTSSTLGKLAKPLTSNYMNHPAMEKIVDGIYGVASDVPGARHGAYRATNFGEDDAEFILNVCASLLIYLAKGASK